MRAGLGKLKLSKLAGVDTSLLSRYERGLRKPGIKNAIKLARGLGVELAEIDEFRPALEEAMEIGLVVEGGKVA